jgi:hypothetical protein
MVDAVLWLLKACLWEELRIQIIPSYAFWVDIFLLYPWSFKDAFTISGYTASTGGTLSSTKLEH